MKPPPCHARKREMEWIRLDASLIAEGLNEKEAAHLLQLRSGADPVPGICAGLAARIRAAVAAGGRCHLQGGADSIPAALRGEAVALLVVKLLVRYAINISDPRKSEAEKAEGRLDAIAKGELPLTDDGVAAAPTYTGRPQRWCHPGAGGVMRKGGLHFPH